MPATALVSKSALPFAFDWRDPDYAVVFRHRIKALERIRANPEQLPLLKAYYKENPADFITDWGMTYDPRNADIGLITHVPFLLFPKQREWIDWLLGQWHSRAPGLTEKSRDVGVSYLAMCTACTLCLFHEGLAVGVGSRKSDYVDKTDEPKSLLWKARFFMENLPPEFKGDWQGWRDAPHMRITFPATGSIISGEGGDGIGRGDRTAFYLVDEYAHFERPQLTEMSLSQTTNCRIDMSSVNGANNAFAKKRHGGKVSVFVFDWRDDPRKDDEWYRLLSEPPTENRKDGRPGVGQGLDPVTIAQEVDRDYSASVEGIVIPAVWVRACVDALKKLGIAPTGERLLSFDVADEGTDKCAAVGTTGVEVDHIENWSGKGSNLFASVQRVVDICDRLGYEAVRYDSDGLGAGVRGDAIVINEQRIAKKVSAIRFEAFRGSEGVFDPDGLVEGTLGQGGKARTNQDYFANRKAQGWWALARRCYMTWRWVEKKISCSPDDILSIPSTVPGWEQLVNQLSQPTRTFNAVGKMVVDKKPDGMPSPDEGDALMQRFARIERGPMKIPSGLIKRVMASGAARRRRH